MPSKRDTEAMICFDFNFEFTKWSKKIEQKGLKRTLKLFQHTQKNYLGIFWLEKLFFPFGCLSVLSITSKK